MNLKRVHLLLTCITCSLLQCSGDSVAGKPPHIIFIFADDLGWNDVSFHGSKQIPTPNIDALASSGLLLHNYYSESICTPSRASLMTGMYPIRLGLQHYVIRTADPIGLPLNATILPQYFKRLGYSTHMIGKWHLGHMKKVFTPIHRGFDTFFGYYNGMIDYFDYTNFHSEPNQRTYYGVDLQNGTKVVKDIRGIYATDLFTEKAINVINDHNASKPLFLYLSHLAVHVGNSYMQYQATPSLIQRVEYIQNYTRRIFGGMVTSLDDSVGSIFKALHQKGFLKNCIFVFVSDNGANPGISSNFPLRGGKFNMWEGGVRLPALIWSPAIQKPRLAKQLIHVTDWLPTLYAAAGGNLKHLGTIDGKNLWNSLLDDTTSPRSEILHGNDPINLMSALRQGDLKLINGTSGNGTNFWPDTAILKNNTSHHKQDTSVIKMIVRELNMELNGTILEESVLDCGKVINNSCDFKNEYCLFNITEDPCEFNNVAAEYPEVVKLMVSRLQHYQNQSIPPQLKARDPMADPLCHNFGFVPWMDEEFKANSCFQSHTANIYRIQTQISTTYNIHELFISRI